MPIRKIARRAVALVLLLAAPAAAQNVHFLDRNGDSVDRALRRLEEKTSSSPDAAAWTDLGWARLLYSCSPDGAEAAFAAAIGLDPCNADALLGMVLTASWRGDDASAGKAVLSVIERAPSSPAAAALMGWNCISPEPHVDRKAFSEALRLGMATASGESLITLKSLYAYTRSIAGDHETAFGVMRECGVPDDFLALGMLGEGGDASFDEELEPEFSLDLAAKYRAGLDEIAWVRVKVLPADRNAYTWQRLQDKIKGRGGCIYFLTFAEVPERTQVTLTTRIGASHKIFVNGALAGCADRYSSKMPGTLYFRATLEKGWNSLMLKVPSSGGAGLDFTRAFFVTRQDFTTVPGMRFSADFAPGDAPATPRGTPADPAAPSEGGVLAALRIAAADQSSRTVPACLALGWMLDDLDLEDEARAVFDGLLAAHAACPVVKHAVWIFRKDDDDYYTHEECEDLPAAAFSECADSNPDFIPARISLGQMHMRKDVEKAVECLRGALLQRPGCFPAMESLYNAYRRKGWRGESVSILREMDRLHAQRPRTHWLWAWRHQGEGNWTAAAERTTRAVDMEGLVSRIYLESCWAATGREDLLIEYRREEANLQPWGPGAHVRLAELLLADSKHDEALESLSKALALKQADSEALRLTATAHALRGDAAAHIKALEAIAAAPARWGVWDDDVQSCLELVRGGRPGMPERYRVDAAKIVREAPAMDRFGKVSTVTLFEQKVVRFYGADAAGAREHGQKVVMILNKKGGERYGRVSLQGETSQARVFHADGRVLEPDPVQEGRWVALPALDRGQAIEICSTREAELEQPGTGVRTLFSAADFRRQDEPVVHYRLVLVFPRGIKFDVKTENVDVQPILAEDGDTVTWTWEFRDLDEFDEERFMPNPEIALPSIRITQGTRDDSLMEREWRSGCMDTTFSAEVARKAADLCKGADTAAGRIRAIYDFCVTEIREGNGSSTQAIRLKQGDARQLFIDLALAAGLEVKFARYLSGFNFGRDFDGQAFEFAGEVICVDAGGEDVFLFPQRFMPFRALPPDALGADALVVSRSGCRWAKLPVGDRDETSSAAVEGTVAVSASGDAAIDGRLKLGGLIAAGLRTWFERGMSESMKKMAVSQVLNQIFQRIRVDSFSLCDFDSSSKTASLTFKGRISGFARKEGETLTFRAVRVPMSASELMAQKTRRKFPAVLDFRGMGPSGVEKMEYVLPEGARAILPPNRAGGGEFGMHLFSARVKGSRVSVSREGRIFSQVVAPRRWEAFTKFLRELEEVERLTIKVVLK